MVVHNQQSVLFNNEWHGESTHNTEKRGANTAAAFCKKIPDYLLCEFFEIVRSDTQILGFAVIKILKRLLVHYKHLTR